MKVTIKLIITLLGLYAFYKVSAHYQDIVINGITIAEGSYECPKRYAAIKHLFDNYARPFTVLDLGASEGYFSFALARDYGAVCVMVEGNYAHTSNESIADRLEELCKENTDISTCVLLKKCITGHELAHLSECEHFDVVLALNFVNHFGVHWQAVLESIRALGDIIIVESPCVDNKNSGARAQLTAIENYLISHNAQILEHVYYKHGSKARASTLYVLKGMQKALTRLDWHTRIPEQLLGKIIIESNFYTKTIAYTVGDQVMRQAWLPGINALTYKELNGVFPLDREDIPDKPQEYTMQGAALIHVPQTFHTHIKEREIK